MTAIEKRMELQDKALIKHVQILTNEISKINPYAKKYKNLYELTKNQKLDNYKLFFLRKTGKERHVYNKPNTAECGAIIIRKNNAAPFDLCVYPKNIKKGDKQYTTINKLTHHINPLVFTLLFPHGNLIWSIGYKKKRIKGKFNSFTILFLLNIL